MAIDIIEKKIARGSWRWIGQRVSGLSLLDVPIAAVSVRSILRHIGGTAYRIGRTLPDNAVVIDRPPLRLLYVRPLYNGYRQVAKKVFPTSNWQVDFDHALGRKIACRMGFSYVLLIRLSPRINRSHGVYERTPPLVGIHKLGFADQRIRDKWIGRSPRFMPNSAPERPYEANGTQSLGLTLKQAGKWGFAMGVEDDPLPINHLTRL